MGEVGRTGRGFGARAGVRGRVLAPAEVAWIVAVPCALVALVAVLALGPALGHALFKPVPTADGLWPPGWRGTEGKPEPVELGRYLVAIAAPPLTAALVLVIAQRKPALPQPLIRPLVLASQLLATAFVALAFLGQHEVVFADRPLPSIFGVGTLLAAAGLLLAALAALRRRDVAERLAHLVRETPGRRLLGVALALAVSVPCLLQGFFPEGVAEDQSIFAWTVNDAFAILDGHTPLVDYHLLYAKLLPYPAALAMAIFGTSAVVYEALMLLLNALALLAVYAIFRRILHSSLLALGLFVPFLALGDVDGSMLLTSMWPMRYGGAYLMAWLVARNVDRGGGRAWPLFAVGAVVAVNETEFGVAALLAALVALVCARPPRSPRAALAFALDAAAGVLAGLALVALPTLLRSGSLPDPALLDEWPRIFTRLGWFSMPMPAVSLHLALYVTFAACLLVAAVRLARADEDRLLTSMLAWSGVFGLLAASYYAGRSDDLKLVSMFSAWAFALALLTIVAARGLAAQGWRRPSLPQLLVLFGFALAICSVAWLPTPQRELSRIGNEAPAAYRPAAERFVDRYTRPHETVAILMPMGHRIAYDLGLHNAFPYPSQEALVTRWQLRTTLDALRRERVRRMFVLGTFTTQQQADVLTRAGFRQLGRSGDLIVMGH